MDKKQILLAAALSGLTSGILASEKATNAPVAPEVRGQCHGVNSCKGTSACHTATNSCAGTNSCKGKGWIIMSKKDCDKKKGKFKV